LWWWSSLSSSPCCSASHASWFLRGTCGKCTPQEAGHSICRDHRSQIVGEVNPCCQINQAYYNVYMQGK
jgi:hypothetical protein